MHDGLASESDFMLGRMNIYIHITGGELDEQSHNRIAATVDDSPVGLHDRMLYDLVANKTTIDIRIDPLRSGTHQRRAGDKSRNGCIFISPLDGIQMLRALPADNLGQTA